MPDNRAAEAAMAELNNSAALGSKNINVRECTPHGYQAALRKKHSVPGRPWTGPSHAGNLQRRRSRSRSPRDNLQHRRSRSRSRSPRGNLQHRRSRSRSRSPRGNLQHRRSRSLSPYGRDAAPTPRQHSAPLRREHIHGRERAVGGIPSRHLFVGNIPPAAEEQAMAEYFSRFGRLQSIKILPKKGPMLTAFVDFAEQADAVHAHESEHTFDGVLLRTDYNSNRRDTGGPTSDYRDRPHDSSLPRGHGEGESRVAAARSDYGQYRTSPPRHSARGASQSEYQQNPHTRGSEGADVVSRPSQRQHGSREWIDGEVVTRQGSGSSAMRQADEANGPGTERRVSSSRADLGAPLQHPQQQHPDAKLFVGNLSRECSASDLRYVFGEFGAINETKVLQDTATGNSRGFGFVHMVDPTDAQRAIAQLHGTETKFARSKGFIVRVAENKRAVRNAGAHLGDNTIPSGQQQQQQMEYASRRERDSWGQPAQADQDYSYRSTSYGSDRDRDGYRREGDMDRGTSRKRSRSRSPTRRESFDYGRNNKGDHDPQSRNHREYNGRDSDYEPPRSISRVETHSIGSSTHAADDRRRDEGYRFDDRPNSAYEMRSGGGGSSIDGGRRLHDDRNTDETGYRQQSPPEQQRYADGRRSSRDGNSGWSAQRRGAPPPGLTRNIGSETRATAGPPGISRPPRASIGSKQ